MMIEQMKKLMVEEEGQGMAEYGLILAGVAAVVVTAVWTLGENIEDVFNNIDFSNPGK